MKKKNLILPFLLTFSSLLVASAQELVNPLPAKLDSIQGLLDAESRKDTVKVKRLNDLALLCLFDMQFQRGLLAARQARQLSKNLNYPKGEGLYLNFMMLISGDSYVNYYYFKIIIFYEVTKEKAEPNKLFELFPPQIDPEKVNVKLLEALKYFEKDNDKEMMAHSLVAISANYQRLNKINESIQYADRARKLFKEIRQPELAFMVSYNKLLALQANKKINEAKEVENEVKAILTNIKDVRVKAMFNYLLSNFYLFDLNKPALGFEYLLKADYELEKIGEKDLRIIILNRLGYNFDNVGLHQKSLDCFKKAVELKIESKKTDDIATDYFLVVFQLISLKKWDEAKLFLEKAKSFTDKINNEQMREFPNAQYHDASGQLLMEEGKYQEALKEFFLVNKIVEESQSEGYFSIYINSYIAQCYQKLGDLQKSIFYAEKSYQQALSAEPRMKIKTSLLLSEVYEETGQNKQAFEYLKKYRSLIKEKEEQDIANLATNLAIENFTQKNEQEKAAFEKEKLIQRWWLFSIAAALLSSFVFLYFLYQSNKHKQKANRAQQRFVPQKS